MRLLMFRSAPRWNCCVQPLAWFQTASSCSSNARKAAIWPASSVWPLRMRAKSGPRPHWQSQCHPAYWQSQCHPAVPCHGPRAGSRRRGRNRAAHARPRGTARNRRRSPPAHRGKPIDPGVEMRRRLDRQGPVRPERGQHANVQASHRRRWPHGAASVSVGSSVVQTRRHIHLPHDAAAGEIAARPTWRLQRSQISRGGLGAQQPIGDAQRTLQFQVGPVVERIAERFGDGFRPLLELFPIGGVAGAEAFLDACGPHRPPLVMVAGEPDLREVGEAAVGGDLGRRQVAMIIDDRQMPGVAVIQRDRPIAFQQEIVAEEGVGHGRIHSTLLTALSRRRAVFLLSAIAADGVDVRGIGGGGPGRSRSAAAGPRSGTRDRRR